MSSHCSADQAFAAAVPATAARLLVADWAAGDLAAARHDWWVLARAVGAAKAGSLVAGQPDGLAALQAVAS